MAVTKDFPSGSAAAPARRSSSCPSPICPITTCSSPSCSQVQTPSQAAQAAVQESLGPAPAQAAAQESLGPAPVPSWSSPGGPQCGPHILEHNLQLVSRPPTMFVYCTLDTLHLTHRTAQYTYIADLTKYKVHIVLNGAQFALHSAIYITLHSTYFTVHSALHTLPYTGRTIWKCCLRYICHWKIEKKPLECFGDICQLSGRVKTGKCISLVNA